jgi:hypothetical protein
MNIPLGNIFGAYLSERRYDVAPATVTSPPIMTVDACIPEWGTCALPSACSAIARENFGIAHGCQRALRLSTLMRVRLKVARGCRLTMVLRRRAARNTFSEALNAQRQAGIMTALLIVAQRIVSDEIKVLARIELLTELFSRQWCEIRQPSAHKRYLQSAVVGE